jgi:choline dehydrogenase
MGIDVVHHNPNVGRNMLDHWNCYSGFDLFHHQDSHNREFRGWRLIWNVLRYQFGFRGALAASTHILAGFDKVDPAASRPDVGIIMAPYSFAVDGKGRIVPAKQPTMHFYSLGLRPTSEGEVHISSGDPALPPMIVQNQLTTEYDQRIAAGGMRLVRRLMSHPALAELVKGRAGADPRCTNRRGACRGGPALWHIRASCLRNLPHGTGNGCEGGGRLSSTVRGVSGLRVIDASVMPTIPSANINAPVMATALRAADLVIEDLR